MEVKKPVDDIKLQLADQTSFEQTCVAARCIDTNENFAVIEGNDIRRSGSPNKLPVQSGHAPIRYKYHCYFLKFA
jgi:hypothetical protein